jgi:hypothetical protein
LVVAHAVTVVSNMLESPYYDRAMEHAREHGRGVLDRAKEALPAGTDADLRLVDGPAARTPVELARAQSSSSLPRVSDAMSPVPAPRPIAWSAE